MNKTEKMREWLFPAILILFILQAMLLPVMIGITYAVPAERPEHILTYTPGRLVWEKDNIVRPDGSAELSFFETLYKNVNADKAQKVLAPGTGKDSVIRLKNDSNKEVSYTAILYSITTSPNLNISVSLSGEGFTDVTGYTLPAKIKQENVIRTVSGKLDAKKCRILTSTGSGIMKKKEMFPSVTASTPTLATELLRAKQTRQRSDFTWSSTTITARSPQLQRPAIP